jgi:hypothetical protein
MTDVQVAIPSYHRAHTLPKKTMPLLHRLGYSDSQVTVFTNADEVPTYRHSLQATGMGDVQVVAAPRGCAAARNALHAHYPVGIRLMSFDDDVRDISIVKNRKLVSMSSEDWAGIVHLAYDACQRSGARMWGGYAAVNPFYMSPTITFGLCFVIGAFYGCINWGADPRRQLTGLDCGDPKDDFERSILCYLADGALVRLNWIGARTAYMKEPGGLQDTRTPEIIRDRCIELTRMYPGLCHLVTSKKSMPYDVRLRDTRKRKESHESRSVVA